MPEPNANAPQQTGEHSSAVSALMVRTYRDIAGRGPTKVRTLMTSDVITVILEGNLTRPEEQLVLGGHEKEVRASRRALHLVMAPSLVAGVQSITGRRVHVLLSDHSLDPDVAVTAFVLATGHGAH